jgi:hypothetical protein
VDGGASAGGLVSPVDTPAPNPPPTPGERPPQGGECIQNTFKPNVFVLHPGGAVLETVGSWRFRGTQRCLNPPDRVPAMPHVVLKIGMHPSYDRPPFGGGLAGPLPQGRALGGLEGSGPGTGGRTTGWSLGHLGEKAPST